MNQANEITTLNHPDGPPRRFSHASVVYKDSMYIFGGGSSTSTTFNDLWRFDLSKRQWIRLQSVNYFEVEVLDLSEFLFFFKLIYRLAHIQVRKLVPLWFTTKKN